MVSFRKYARRIRILNTAAFFATLAGLVYIALNFQQFTGLLVSTESFYASPGFEAGQSGEFAWHPEQEGLLTSLKLSGRITGNGTVRVYLQAGESTFLVLDSTALSTGNQSPAGSASQGFETTGMLTAGENETAPEETSNLTGNMNAPAENFTENMSASISSGNVTEEAASNITAPENESEEFNLTEENVTGENITANVTENVTAPENESAGLNMTEENVTGENITANVTENVTAPETPVQILYFEDACLESCSLPELNESSYMLTFEIGNDTVLRIESIRYSLLRYEAPGPMNSPPSGEIPNQIIELGKALAINLSMFFSDPDNDSLYYAEESGDSLILNSYIEGDILKAAPLQEGNFTVNISVTDGNITIFSSFLLSVLPQNITENVTENLTGPSLSYCSGCLDCSEKILSSAPGSLVFLDSDISGSGNCIEFSGSLNLTLDCQGHRITGSGLGCGILFTSSRENLVKKCIIEGFRAGAYLDRDSTLNSIYSLSVSGNDYGISLFSSTSNTLEEIDGRIRVSSSSRNAISCM